MLTTFEKGGKHENEVASPVSVSIHLSSVIIRIEWL